MPKVSREVPLAEITLRKYEPPKTDDHRELCKKVCLSLGLLMPGDFRDVIVDVFLAIIQSNTPLTSKQIEQNAIEIRKQHQLSVQGTASSNIRRQLRRLKQLYLIENVEGAYRLTENLSLTKIWDERIRPALIESTEIRIKEHLAALDAAREE